MNPSSTTDLNTNRLYKLYTLNLRIFCVDKVAHYTEKVNHNWFKYLNAEQIDLGLGIREIEKHGQHIRKYQIVVKEEQI